MVHVDIIRRKTGCNWAPRHIPCPGVKHSSAAEIASQQLNKLNTHLV